MSTRPQMHEILQALIRYAPRGMGSQVDVIAHRIWGAYYDGLIVSPSSISRIVRGIAPLPIGVIAQYGTSQGRSMMICAVTDMLRLYPGAAARMMVYHAAVPDSDVDIVLDVDIVGRGVGTALYDAMIRHAMAYPRLVAALAI